MAGLLFGLRSAQVSGCFTELQLLQDVPVQTQVMTSNNMCFKSSYLTFSLFIFTLVPLLKTNK